MDSRPTDPIRVALVGYGYSGRVFHAPLVGCTPGLQLTCVVSSNASKVTRDVPGVRVAAVMEGAFPDADLFVIATPNDSHFELAQKALAAGKHVVVEKPFTVRLADAEYLAELAKQSGRLLSVFQNRRWDGDFLTVSRILREKRLGDVMSFESHYDRFRPEVKTRWREAPGAGGGLWYDLGPHLIDQALQLFGTPEAVYADFELQRAGARATDYFHVLLRYARTRVILHASSLTTVRPPRFAIHGTLGSFTKYGMDVQEEALLASRVPSGLNWGRDPINGRLVTRAGEVEHSEEVQTIPGNYLAYYEALLGAIRGEKPNPVSVDAALGVMKILEAGLQSAKSRTETRMPSAGGLG